MRNPNLLKEFVYNCIHLSSFYMISAKDVCAPQQLRNLFKYNLSFIYIMSLAFFQLCGNYGPCIFSGSLALCVAYDSGILIDMSG